MLPITKAKSWRSRAAGSVALLCLAAVLAAETGCRCVCGESSEPLARVVDLVPVTEISTNGGAWDPAEQNDDLSEGDALRTGDAGTATLEVIGQGSVKIGPRSLVRFGDPAQAGQRGGELQLVLETGELQAQAIDAEAPALVLTGPSGQRVRLERGSRVRMLLDAAEQLHLEVEEGSTQIEHQGETTDLNAGQSFMFGVAERLPPDAPANEPDAGAEDPGDVAVGDAGGEDAAPDAGDAVGVPLRNLGGAEIEIQAPGEEGYSKVRRTRSVIPPGSAIKVSGRDGVELSCCGGAAVVLQPGARAVIAGSSGGRLVVRLRSGRADARGGGGGLAALDVPGGHAETANVGAAGAFTAVVRDSRSTRIAVRSGAAHVRSGTRDEVLYTGAEVVLGPESFTVTHMRETRPVFHGSASYFDPARRGTFTIRFDPLPGCETHVVRVERRGRRMVEAATKRPLVVVQDAEYGEYRWRAGCLVDGEADWSTTREGRVGRHPDGSSRSLLPTKAPSSSLDSDGRHYTVTYQNRLPSITLRWRNAPESSTYYVEVVEEGSGRRVHSGRAPRPIARFRSGRLREGRYYWFFRAEGEGGRATSPVTFARISFDNQSPTIHIAEPRNGAAASGSVRVRGTAAVGSTVVANGVALTMGGDFRFDQQVPVGPDNLLIIHVATPGRGSGTYLRHLNR